MSHRMYQEDPLAKDFGLTQRMRDWIAQPYVAHRGDTGEDDEEAEPNANQQGDQLHQDEEIAQNSPVHSQQEPIIPNTQGELAAQGEHAAQGGGGHQASQLVTVSASSLAELLSLTRDLAQRVTNIETDLKDLRNFLIPDVQDFSFPSNNDGGDDDNNGDGNTGPQGDDVQKGGETGADDDDGDDDDDNNDDGKGGATGTGGGPHDQEDQESLADCY